MRTIFATSVDVDFQLYREETVDIFAYEKFVGTSTVDHITHYESRLLIGLGTHAAGPQVRPSRYRIGGYRTLTLLFRNSLLPTNIYK